MLVLLYKSHLERTHEVRLDIQCGLRCGKEGASKRHTTWASQHHHNFRFPSSKIEQETPGSKAVNVRADDHRDCLGELCSLSMFDENCNVISPNHIQRLSFRGSAGLHIKGPDTVPSEGDVKASVRELLLDDLQHAGENHIEKQICISITRSGSSKRGYNGCHHVLDTKCRSGSWRQCRGATSDILLLQERWAHARLELASIELQQVVQVSGVGGVLDCKCRSDQSQAFWGVCSRRSSHPRRRSRNFPSSAGRFGRKGAGHETLHPHLYLACPRTAKHQPI